MSFNGSGTFLINTAGQPVVSGTVISSTAFNALTADLATGLSTCITKDGQTTPTANIPMGSNRITGLGSAVDATDAATFAQAQSTAVKLIGGISGADTITGALTPAITAYAAGQMFYFVAAGANTGAVTLNINSLGAKAVTRDGSTALAAGDIVSGEVVVVVYDGTRFQVVSQLNSSGDARFANVSIASALSVGGVATFTGLTASKPVFTDASKNLTSSGTLGVDQGGTGQTTYTNGQLLIGNTTGNTLTKATLTAGTGISVTNGTGSITIASTILGVPTMSVVTGTTQSAAVNTHYILTNGSATTVTLPASPTAGDLIWITVANGLTTNVVARNGKPIQGIAEDMTLNAAYASAQMRFVDNTEGWVLV
jgi:hypothetical protein